MGACNLLDYGQLTTVKRCICWPESHDRMAGSARPAISFELIADLSLCFQLVPKGHALSQVMGSWWSVDLWISLQWFQVHCSTNRDGYIILLFLKYFSFSNWRSRGPDLFFGYKSLNKNGRCIPTRLQVNIQPDTLTFTDLILVEQMLRNFLSCFKVLESRWNSLLNNA